MKKIPIPKLLDPFANFMVNAFMAWLGSTVKNPKSKALYKDVLLSIRDSISTQFPGE